MRDSIFLLCAPLLLGVPARSQSIQKIVEVGDAIPGVGNVLLIKGPSVNDQGRAYIYAYTDNPDPVLAQVLLDESGAVAYQGGQSLAQPSGTTIASFSGGEVCSSATGPAVFLLKLAGTSGMLDDDGYFYGTNLDLALQESSVSTAPQLTAGSTYVSMLPPLINDSYQIAFHTTIDDPNIIGTYDFKALMVSDLIAGTQHVVYKENDLLPGQSFTISGFNWDSGNLSFNNAGQILFGATINSAPGSNGVLYLDDTKLAQKGEPSPWGSNYVQVSTSLTASDLNSAGHYAFSASVGGGYGIVKDGVPFVRAGDALPDIAPHKLSEIGQVLRLGDDDTVVWSGFWQLPDGSQSGGIFVDYSLVVEEGVTRIGGLLVTDVTGLDHHLTTSRSGQYLEFVVGLENGGMGAYLIDLWQ